MDNAQADAAVKAYESSRARYVTFADSLRVLVEQLVAGTGVAADSVTARAKETQSLADKLKRRPRYTSLDDLPDLVGVRVVTRYQADVDVVCELLGREFTVVEDVVHGAEEAEAFGYASRHLVVELVDPRAELPEWAAFRGIRAEIQVRSILQHAWASISHGLDYKTDSAVPQEVRRQLFRVAALLETGDELFDDFRRRVDALRVTYTEDVSKDEWRDLPLNLDSLRAAFDRLPLPQAAAAAVVAGWQDDPEWMDDTDGDLNVYLQRLIQVFSAAGYKTIGEVGRILEEATADAAWLARIAEEGDARDYVPYAIPTDVALLRVVTTHPDAAVVEAADDSTIATPLVSAAVAAAESER